jgi:signal transduction histidine kinase
MAHIHWSETAPDSRDHIVWEVPSLRQTRTRKKTVWRDRDIPPQLTHANRIATMGRLAASIPHEVKQPVAAMITNAQAALRLLEHQAPDLKKLRDALVCIVEDGKPSGRSGLLARGRDSKSEDPLFSR